MSTTPKILYVEDDLAKNIPRLLRLFEKYLSKTEVESLKQLENDLDGYGAEPEDIQKIFKGIQLIDIEYRFSDALSKIMTHPEQYALFIVDRNLSEADYTFEEVRKVDPQYTQDFHKCFSEREGDYLLLKLVMAKRVDVLEKFYFLTAYTTQADEIRSCMEIKNLIDFGAFRARNFIEKGNEDDSKRLSEVIEKSAINKPELQDQIQASLSMDAYTFAFTDGTTVKGSFISPVLKIQTQNGKKALSPNQIQEIIRANQHQNADFRFILKTGDILLGRIVERKLLIKTQIDPEDQIICDNIQSIKLV